MQRSNNFLAVVQINGQLEVDSPPPKLLISDINVDISYNFKSNGYLTTEESDFNTLKGILLANASGKNGILFWISGSCKSVVLKKNVKGYIKYYLLESCNGSPHDTNSPTLLTLDHVDIFLKYLCSTYLNENNKFKTPYHLQFGNFTCNATTQKQKLAVRKHKFLS